MSGPGKRYSFTQAVDDSLFGASEGGGCSSARFSAIAVCLLLIIAVLCVGGFACSNDEHCSVSDYAVYVWAASAGLVMIVVMLFCLAGLRCYSRRRCWCLCPLSSHNPDDELGVHLHHQPPFRPNSRGSRIIDVSALSGRHELEPNDESPPLEMEPTPQSRPSGPVVGTGSLPVFVIGEEAK